MFVSRLGQQLFDEVVFFRELQEPESTGSIVEIVSYAERLLAPSDQPV